jgi:hypothetical protein
MLGGAEIMKPLKNKINKSTRCKADEVLFQFLNFFILFIS